MNNEDPRLLEQQAHDFVTGEKYIEAFRLYQQAANIYKRSRDHKQAALCFAAAASCWSKKSGEKTFYNAALSFEAAAQQAEVSADLEYAALLYKYAAINYERDGEFINFSAAFYHSKECYRTFLFYRLLNPRKIHPIMPSSEPSGMLGFIKRLFLWFCLTVSNLIWGHGERPVRTIYAGMGVIIVSALCYSQASLLKNGAIFSPHFSEALYFSIVTFTTLGYGDLTPVGLARLAASIEALCGIFITSLFLIGLSRKYLRV